MSGKDCTCVCHKLGYVSCIGHCDSTAEPVHTVPLSMGGNSDEVTSHDL